MADSLEMDLTSPQNSVDLAPKDMASVQEELERRLRCRADRDDLVKKGILPDMSTSPKLFTQAQQLHRARISDNLQKRLRNRADRHELMKLNILPDLHGNIDPGLQAKQLQLRKSRLADHLNVKLAHRPGPLELIKGGILEPRNAELAAAVHSVPFERTGTKDGSAEAAALPQTLPGPSSLPSLPSLPSPPSAGGGGGHGGARRFSESSLSPADSPGGTFEESVSPGKSPQPVLSPPFPLPHHAHLKEHFGKAPSPSATRKKQAKQQKYRKLRYHEYVPPSKGSGKGGKTTPKASGKSDSPYGLLLQQQQLFLQLQVLQQQYPNGVLMQKLPDLVKNLSSKKGGDKRRGSNTTTPPGSVEAKPVVGAGVTAVLQVEQPNRLSVSGIRFDELKVNDLKAACKEMGMIVSGKKAELVERLLEANRGLLPALALPDARDQRRHTFSHASSSDSQLSTHSPSSPSPSPIFKFPGEHGAAAQGSLRHASSTGRAAAPAPQVFPATDLQQQFNEMIERQKRSYISHPKTPKSLAPRPELGDMVAIKFPRPIEPARSKGSTLPHRASDSKLQLQLTSEKTSRSLPSSPRPLSPAPHPPSPSEQFFNEIMDDADLEDQLTASLPSTFSSGPLPPLDGPEPPHSSPSPLFFIPKSLPTSVAGPVRSLSDSPAPQDPALGPPPAYYQAEKPGLRPNRASMPAMATAKLPSVPPPSYNSRLHLIHRSHSLSTQAPPHLHTGLPHLHSGPAPGTDTSELLRGGAGDGMMLTDDGMVGDLMEMPMDMDCSKDAQFSEIFDILRDSDQTVYASPGQPLSLSGHAPYPKSLPHDSIMFSGGPFSFGSPSLGQVGRSGSDLCLGPAREGQKNSGTNLSGVYPAVPSGSELGWLDLTGDNAPLSLSPTIGAGPFSSLGHSNPGSLPHDQFTHMGFYEDQARPLHNGHAPLYLDPHQAPLYPPTSDDAALLELGLSR